MKDARGVVDSFLCTKSCSRAYEREELGLRVEAGTLLRSAPDALKRVDFGPRVDGADLDRVRQVLAGHDPNVEFDMGGRILKVHQATSEPLPIGSANAAISGIDRGPVMARLAAGN